MAAIVANTRIRYVGGGRFTGNQFFVNCDSVRTFGQLRIGDVGVVHRVPGAKGDLGCTFGKLRVSLNVEDVHLMDSSYQGNPCSQESAKPKLPIVKKSLRRAAQTPKLLEPLQNRPIIASLAASSPSVHQHEDAHHGEGALLVRTNLRSPTFGVEAAPTLAGNDVMVDDARPHPPSFYCPISHQCMHDPVVLTDGHTYERRHIERWLKSSNTSPVSGAVLSQKVVFPNHALRNAIEEYFCQVFSEHRDAIQQATRGLSHRGGLGSNATLLRTIDALMQCSILINEDLSVELVLKRIMDEAKSLVGSEVASVFLVDREREELFSTVNSTGGELRIPNKSGIAGRVAYFGSPLVINDAYSDSRFNTEVDAKTGFKTRNILCVPIMGGAKGGIIGVAQLVNKTGTGVLQESEESVYNFTEGDVQFFQVLASQAGAAIVNSGMFERMPAVGNVRRRWSPDLTPQSSTSSLVEVEGSPRHRLGSTRDAMVGCADTGTGSPVTRSAVGSAMKAVKLRTLQPLLQAAAEEWQTDTLTLAELSGNKPLSVLACYLLRASGVVERLALDDAKLSVFMQSIEDGYPDSNQYHNKAHAASVVHFMYMILSHGGLADAVARATVGANERPGQRQLDFVMLAGLLAASIHDFEHDGLNNSFLVASGSPKAIRYNDKSPNENHHAAAAFKVLLKPECNFLEDLKSDEYRELRKLVVEMVLGTDMAEGGKLLKTFQEVTSGSKGDFAPASAQEVILSLQMALKCADVGHLALGWSTHMRWVRRLEEEFFAQGKQEKKLGMPEVSFLMDDEKPGVSETQVGFFNFVALPLFRSFTNAFAKALPMLSAVERNYRKWSDIDIAAKTST